MSMKEKWPVLAGYFGLESPSGDPNVLPPSEYVKKHTHVLRELGIKDNAVFQGGFLDTYGLFDRHMNLEKIRKAGFDEEVDSMASWSKAFDKFKEAGMIIR
ncbi:putative sirq protein [Lyophyllum shimeji]|uniref:Sirq protein n=1 Tax=Lyophyllum shimeji TaxID=47721 RepID=A0A9P3PUG5_LYOSH|nr:putative sirq protein [Lyophyllum shimeji]